MSKDVINDRYGRLYELPLQLAKRGHSVAGLCLSYRSTSEGSWTHDALPGTLRWHSWNLGRSVLPGLIRFNVETRRLLLDFKPDILIGASDIPHCAMGRYQANALRTPLAIDLYDNFESFGQAKIPGAVNALRWAARGASLITCVSEPLTTYVSKHYKTLGKITTLESTVDKAIFRPGDRMSCRARLGLPPEAKMIGTAGALSKEKGIETLYRAFEILAERDQAIHLALAGPVEAGTPPPKHPRVHLLGELPHADVATFFAAMNVSVISIRDTPFGRYCFPQKAYEMLACGVPVVAADIGAMSPLFRSYPASLFKAEDAGSLADAVSKQLWNPEIARVPIKDWSELTEDLEMDLQSALAI